jgi:hypothetical protein
MLAQARDWLARRRDDLSPAEEGYIEASIALRRRAEEERAAFLPSIKKGNFWRSFSARAEIGGNNTRIGRPR